MKNKKLIYRKGLLQHHYRFGIIGNIKVWWCRTFGHELNINEDHEWCNRCGLAYTEIYHKKISIHKIFEDSYNEPYGFKNILKELNI